MPRKSPAPYRFDLVLVVGLLGCADPASPAHHDVAAHPVSFRNGEVVLGGTIFLPRRSQPCPGVVMVHGSGPSTRKSFKGVVEHFAARGIAVLAYDKRGTGESGGDWQTATYETLADDAIAGLGLLRSWSGVRKKCVGLWGISQGGWILPIAAARAAPDFVIVVSGCAQTARQQQRYLHGNNLRRHGFTSEDAARASELFDFLYDTPKDEKGLQRIRARLQAEHDAPWFTTATMGLATDQMIGLLKGIGPGVMDYDPRPALRSLTVPALVIFGGADQDVDPELNERLWRESLTQAGNADFRIRVFPGAGHGLTVSTPEGPRFADGYLPFLTDWVLSRR